MQISKSENLNEKNWASVREYLLDIKIFRFFLNLPLYLNRKCCIMT